MDRQRSSSSHSSLGDLPPEKHDPLLDHLRNVDAMSNREISDLHRESMAKGNEQYDLELQGPPMGRGLTRTDTAAWVTKHPSRIPDEGTTYPVKLALTLAMRKKELTYIVEFEGPDDPLN